jgi:hypothetical protein
MSATSAKEQMARKVRRQKQFVAIGSLVLLALLGFQLPKLMGGSETAAPVVSSTAPTSGSPLAVASGSLPDTDQPVIQRDAGQLLSFGLFKSKDPFVQQLSTLASPLSEPPAPSPIPVPAVTTTPAATTTVPKPTPVPGGGGAPTTSTPSSTVPFPSTTPSPTPAPAPVPAPTTPATPTQPATTTATTPAAPTAAPTSVAISTNGYCETVSVNGTFPGNEDIFRVVSIAKDGKSAKIAVVGGAYDSGQATATLKMGEKLTLVNTADGTRYLIVLKAKCDVESTPVAPSISSTSTSTTTTVAAVPPTTTVTTPIVTDSLDTTVPSP